MCANRHKHHKSVLLESKLETCSSGMSPRTAVAGGGRTTLQAPITAAVCAVYWERKAAGPNENRLRSRRSGGAGRAAPMLLQLHPARDHPASTTALPKSWSNLTRRALGCGFLNVLCDLAGHNHSHTETDLQ